MENPFSLVGKTILVTGASSGIGKGIAIASANMGAKVFITARREDKLKDVVNEMVGDNDYYVADLTVSNDIDKLVDFLPELDGVVHCAGIGSRVLCKNITEESIDQLMHVNFYAPVLLQAALLSKKRIKKNASIVFVASMSTDSPSMGNAIYSASKGAILSYSRCLSIELAPRKIRVNCISPAMVWTDLIIKDGLDEMMLKENEIKYPLGRFGKPEDIAGLVVYLLSNVSEWMTGSNISITGGAR